LDFLEIIGLAIVIPLVILRYRFKVDSRLSIIVSIILLLLSAGLLTLKFPDGARFVSILSFYCLVTGFALICLDLLSPKILKTYAIRSGSQSFFGTIPAIIRKYREGNRPRR
jgi:hypothetical protein